MSVKRGIVHVVTVAVFVFFLNGLSLASNPIVFKLGTVDNPKMHSGIGSEAFAKEVKRLSGGTMEVKVFHAGKLGNIPTQLENVLSGSQDMHLLYSEFLGGFIPESKVLCLPYVFKSLDHLQKFYKSDIWKKALAKMERKGAVVIDPTWTWFIHDPRGFVCTRPIFTPKDMKGLKLRIWEAKAAIATWKGFGANPIVVPRPEMYLAFKQGIIEAGPETIGIAYAQKNVEMAKYFVRTEEYYQILNIMINKRKWESLNDSQQNILREAMLIAGKVFSEATRKNWEEKKRQSNLEYGVSVIEPALKPWRAAGKATVDRLVKDNFVSKELIDGIRALEN